MKTPKRTTYITLQYRDKRVDQWANILVICSILLVLLLTLFPFQFYFKNPALIDYRALIFSGIRYDYPIEILANIVLFIPLGFALTCLIQKTKLEGIAAVIVIQALSTALSFTIEILQIFLPSRLPSLIDLLTNSVGAFIGFLCFRLWGVKILSYASAIAEKCKGCLSLKKLTLAFIGYTTLSFLISIHFANATNFWNLSNWDQTFPLLLGNEPTGDRP
jgi:VanZ family protein